MRCGAWLLSESGGQAFLIIVIGGAMLHVFFKGEAVCSEGPPDPHDTKGRLGSNCRELHEIYRVHIDPDSQAGFTGLCQYVGGQGVQGF